MTGRVCSFRSTGRNTFQITADDQPLAEVLFREGAKGSLAIAAYAEATARIHGDVFVDPRHAQPGTDWARLGWTDEAEHRAMVADVARLTAEWGDPDDWNTPAGEFARAAHDYVRGEKTKAGIPTSPPYTVDQLDELDRIVRRTTAVITQDLAAEGTTPS